jgi:putative transposase
MENDNDILYNPHSVRLKDYDYSQPGAYFVTICAYARHCFFGEVRNIEVVLNEFGTIVESCWNEIPEHFPLVNTDYLVVMPNHLHGIVIIYEGNRNGEVGFSKTRHAVSLHNNDTFNSRTEAFGKPVPASLPTIIRSFKSITTRRIRETGNFIASDVWPRNYYEHVIRNEEGLSRAIEYIDYNPAKWELDRDNPKNI